MLPDIQAAMQAVAVQRLFSAAAARPDWPTILTASTPRPARASAIAEQAAPLARQRSKRARRRAAGKLKAAGHAQV